MISFLVCQHKKLSIWSVSYLCYPKNKHGMACRKSRKSHKCASHLHQPMVPWIKRATHGVILVCNVTLEFGGGSLHWRHNDHDGVSNHQPHGCLLNRLFRRRSKKTSKLRVTGLCVGNSPGPVNSPHKGPVTRKMFPFDDVIMCCLNAFNQHHPDSCFSDWQDVFSYDAIMAHNTFNYNRVLL